MRIYIFMQINNAGQNGTELNMELAASVVDEAGMVSIYIASYL